MSMLNELAAYLQDQGIGRIGETIFIARLPDAPPFAIGLLEYPGAAAEYIQEQSYGAIEKPRVQINVRATSDSAVDYDAAYEIISSIHRAIDTIKNVVLSGTRYLRGYPLQRPYLLMYDANEQPLLIFNAELWRAAA